VDHDGEMLRGGGEKKDFDGSISNQLIIELADHAVRDRSIYPTAISSLRGLGLFPRFRIEQDLPTSDSRVCSRRCYLHGAVDYGHAACRHPNPRDRAPRHTNRANAGTNGYGPLQGPDQVSALLLQAQVKSIHETLLIRGL
jgi:hypothetical protein